MRRFNPSRANDSSNHPEMGRFVSVDNSKGQWMFLDQTLCTLQTVQGGEISQLRG
jgi:hypothetical protein